MRSDEKRAEQHLAPRAFLHNFLVGTEALILSSLCLVYRLAKTGLPIRIGIQWVKLRVTNGQGQTRHAGKIPQYAFHLFNVILDNHNSSIDFARRKVNLIWL